MINVKFFIIIAFSMLYSSISYASQSTGTYYYISKSISVKDYLNSGDNKSNILIGLSCRSNTVTICSYTFKSSVIKGNLNSRDNKNTYRIVITGDLNYSYTVTAVSFREEILDDFNTEYKIFNTSNFINYRCFNEEKIYSKKISKYIDNILNSKNKNILKITPLILICEKNINYPRVKVISFVDSPLLKLIKLKPNLFFIKQDNSYINPELKSKVHVIV